MTRKLRSFDANFERLQKYWEFSAEYGEGRAIKIKFIRKIRDNYGIAALILKGRDIKFSKSTLQSKADDKFFVIRLVL